MYYFTEQDPDYRIKGSRDPLGFQVLWQKQGNELIPYLSTVSTSMHDFQILCLSHFLYPKEPDSSFVSFFLRFEQLMAYARLHSNDNKGFNGIGRAKKIYATGKMLISRQNEILSNQRSYGIWGKYNRPFRDIAFLKHEKFKDIFHQKLQDNPDIRDFDRISKNLLEKDSMQIELKDLDCLLHLLKVNGDERKFYEDTILKVSSSNSLQNNLFDYLSTNGMPEKFELYTFLDAFRKSSECEANEKLKSILLEIEKTERVLCPLNRIFRYLQTKPLWSKEAIEADTNITNWKRPIDYLFSSEEEKQKNSLSQIMELDNWPLVTKLVDRNTEISSRRGGTPWLAINGTTVEIHHADGKNESRDFNPAEGFDNGYFIDNYIDLFKQIMRANA